MQITEKLLSELAALAETERSVLSVYLDTSRGWDYAKQLFERELDKRRRDLSESERSKFDEALPFVRDAVNERHAGGYDGPGLAVFCDLGADYLETVELPAPPAQRVVVDDEALIHPLAVLLDEFEPVGVIAVDNTGARIYIAAGRALEESDSFRKQIKNLVKVGGWSQMRYQRRRAKQVKHLLVETAQRAERIFREEGIKRVALVGRQRMLGDLERELPKAVAGRIIGRIAWDVEAGEDDLLWRLGPLMEKAEREQEEALLEHFRGELRRGGLAAGGLEDVQRCLTYGSVDVLLLDEGVDAELAEELTGRAESTAAHVEHLPGRTDELAPHGGVGALLRFRVHHED